MSWNTQTKAPCVRNPILEIDCCELPIPDTSPIDRFAFLDKSINYGISPDSLPLGPSQAPFKLKTLDEQEYSLELVAGFIGVRQDSEQGTLQPEIGWAIRERDDRFSELLDKIQQQHLTQSPINWSKFYPWEEVPKEHIQLLDRFDGATLYANSGHAWQIVKYDDRKSYELPEPLDSARSAIPLIDLEDGRALPYLWWKLSSY